MTAADRDGDEPVLVDSSHITIGDPESVNLDPIFAAIEAGRIASEASA